MSLKHDLQVLNDLSRSLLSTPPDDFLKQVAVKAVELLSASACIVWKFDKQRGRLRVVATTDNVDEEFQRIELNVYDPGLRKLLAKKKTGYLQDVRKSHPNYYTHQEEESRRGWVSLLSAPMWANDELIGVLDVYTESVRYFTPLERDLFNTFAYQAAAAIQKGEAYREALLARERLQDLNYRIAGVRDLQELLNLLLDGALELVNSKRGWIGLLDPVTGTLEINAHRGDPPNPRGFRVGEGISGKALEEGHPIMAGDVTAEEWRGMYSEFWPDTRSTLAVPILVTNAEARIGSQKVLRAKPVGLLNIESPEVNAFSSIDVKSIWSWACLAAVTIERLELDRKLRELADIETAIVGKRGFDETIEVITRGITETLGYDYVNISLVVPELNQIRTEYIVGIPAERVEEFKRLAIHSLDSMDIQASIYRERKIEVPDVNDHRFDKKIYQMFGHINVIRVFIPMIAPSDGRVIGTVEAGYQKPGHRKYIYEQDVQILQSFLNYAVQALEQRDKGRLETISHEFRSSIVGIQANANFLRRRFEQLDELMIENKFRDIETDCEILLSQVEELDYILGRAMPPSRSELTLVMRDVVIKVIQQLKPLIAERHFDLTGITYNRPDVGRIRLYIDSRKLNQVFYNLLINSIKYAEDDPKDFMIRVSTDETSDAHIIKVKDWGMGVRKEFTERIFEQGFRSPEALNKNVTGSGLGLTIARKIMREMGGDLILVNNRKPTEFHVVLPKSLREAPQ